MRNADRYRLVLLIAVAFLIANSCVFGQRLQLSPREVYESIPTRPTSESRPPDIKVSPIVRSLPGPDPNRDVSGRQTLPGTRSEDSGAIPRTDPAGQSGNDDHRKPSSADLTRFLPPVGNQVEDGDCVAWAFAYASYSCQICQSRNRDTPTAKWEIFSPAYVANQLYANNKGLIPFDAVNLLKREGCASLVTMPPGKNPPTATAKAEAATFRAVVHERAKDLDDIRDYLDEGFPVILIVQLDKKFRSLGSAAMPYKWSAEKSQDFHAVTAVGYDDQKNAVKIMNSWGTNWGDQGFGWVQYDTLQSIDMSNWCAEAHVVKVKMPRPATVETPETARTDSRVFQLRADQNVYEKVQRDFQPISTTADRKIIDIVCDDSDLFVLRQNRTVDLMQDFGPGSAAENRMWLHLSFGPMTNKTAAMLAANPETTLYILTTDGDVIEYHERTSPQGVLVRINPPIDDQSTTIDLRVFGNELRAITTSGKVFVHNTNDVNGRWKLAESKVNSAN